jgi:hypothetical protein
VADAVAVDRLAAGDHACLTYSDPDERLDVLGLVGTVLDAYGLPGTPRIRVRAT